LGNESEMVELMQLGNIEAFRGGVYESQCPMLDIYTMPFMFKDLKAIQKITRGPIGEKIAQNAETKGLKILATGDGGGFRNLTNNVRAIRTPEDMKGLKMRTPPLESIIETMKALGANPVSIPYVEVYMALKTGVADGQENPFVNIATMKFHEVQKYMTVVNYQFHPEPFTVNLEWFNSLSPELQEIIQTTAKEVLVMHDDMIDGAAQEAFDTIKNAGVEITFLTDEERQPFIDQVQSVYDYYTEEKGLFSKADLDEIRQAVQE
jgi:C4-dicarboxylate-binding protein DctP